MKYGQKNTRYRLYSRVKVANELWLPINAPLQLTDQACEWRSEAVVHRNLRAGQYVGSCYQASHKPLGMQPALVLLDQLSGIGEQNVGLLRKTTTVCGHPREE